ncbi:butyryl-CoA dehydrogenase [Rhodoligotrophos appendicifer]|uniref:acyl-CoA dehydrogenase n=1 Tax=Rhodoligotrophos appendicifer TaxID=987056 RepID=UPI00117EFD70|nr:acyl-CoA dehydrogenase [Rhodoligotrophos appendicifer]
MSATAHFLSRRDLDFLLYEVLDVERLTERERFAEHSRETFDAALDLSEQLAADLFRPHNKLSDQNEPRFENGRVVMIPEVKTAVDAFAAAGLLAATHDAEIGGMQLPMTIAQACFACFDAANIATAAYTMLTIANANLLRVHGSEEQRRLYLEPLLQGRFLGTMCLSETQAGSSLADIRTMADPLPDGTYSITGSKMWISAGEHDLSENIIHLVLARLRGAPAGAKGISLFVVPKRLVEPDGRVGAPNNVALAGLNHKMGYRGTTNCVLNFGESGTTVGTLVGEPHQGLAYMFQMMNEARIAIGRGATMLGYTGYLASLDYARSRHQGRSASAKDPSRPPVAIIEHADVRRMLLAQKAYVEGALGLILICAQLVDEAATAEDEETRARAHLLLDVLTPVAKSWPSKYGPIANDLAIQVHGGYGYTREFDVEQFYRDNRLNPIHEGTNGIQALDLLGRKVMMQEGQAFSATVEAMRETVELAEVSDDADCRAWGESLAAALDDLVQTTAVLRAEANHERRLANASLYLDAFGHTVIAWVWLRQALTAARPGQSEDPFYAGKRQACCYFFAWELPTIAPFHHLLRGLDPTPLEMQDAWF